MKILLINFHDYTKYTDYKDKLKLIRGKRTVHSLTLMQLASLIPEKYYISILDNPSNVDFDKEYDLVGISTVTTLAKHSYMIADEFRKKGATVVLGGFHPSALPEEAIRHADSVVIGEAEITWPKLLKDFEKGKLNKFYKQEKPVDLNSIPNPKRDIYKNFSKVAPIELSRGCPVGCDFCTISNTAYGRIFRTRPIENVIGEIRDLPQKYLWLCDPSLTTKPNYTKAFFRQIKDFNKKLVKCNGNVNILAKDDEFLRLASDAGCLEWLVGFDSISQMSINQVGKKTNKIKEYRRVVKKIHDYGMMVMGSLIFGFDTDTLDIFDKSYDFINEIGIDVIPINILTPYPGTPLFKKLNAEGRILTKDWSKYTTREVVFQPKNMTPDELMENTIRLHQKLHKTSHCMSRIIGSINLGIYPVIETAKINIYSKVTKIF